MSENGPERTREGDEVFVITYDDEGNEVRLSPVEADDATDRSRNLGLGLGSREIIRIKHGPFVAAELEIRMANVASLAAALAGNYLGSALYVDRSQPPVDDDVLELDNRFHLDVYDGQLVAVITQRHAKQPAQTPNEIAASLARVAQAYGCSIHDVSFILAGGGTPEEFLQPFVEDRSELGARFHAENLRTLAGIAHDVHIEVSIDGMLKVGSLIAGATAIADFLKATKDGPLDASGVINLLRAGHFDLLIGESESEYLEVKTALHPIWVSGTPGEKAKIELAQDIARFANGETDAILVIGFREAAGGGSTIGSVAPVDNSYINISQINEVLDARIVPPVDGLFVDTFATSPAESLIAIFVPKQPPEMQPYLVHGAIAEDKVEGAFFSIVRRRGEGSITTSAEQIHAYIVAGKRLLRGDETL